MGLEMEQAARWIRRFGSEPDVDSLPRLLHRERHMQPVLRRQFTNVLYDAQTTNAKPKRTKAAVVTPLMASGVPIFS